MPARVRLCGGELCEAHPGKFASDRARQFRDHIGRCSPSRWCFRSGWRSTSSISPAPRAALQNAIDLAVLAMAREGKDVSDEQGGGDRPKIPRWQFRSGQHQFKVDKIGTRFSVNAETNAGLAFGGLLGYQNWPVQAPATADIAYASYEIALVLDTTGSMKGGKLSSMKDSVLGLIDTMSMQVNDEDKLKFAMVPFAAFVNVGPKYGPTFDKEGQAGRRQRRRLARPQWQFDVPQSRARCRGQPLPALQQSRAELAGLRRNALFGQQGLRRRRHAAPIPSRRETLFVPAFAIDEPDTPQFSNSYINSDAKPKDKQRRGEEEALGQIRRRDRCVRQPAEWRPARARSTSSARPARQPWQVDDRSTPAHRRTPASQRARGTAATCNRSRR